MTALLILGNVFWTAAFTLSMTETFRRPARMMCDCRAGFMAFGHLKSRWLLVIAVCYLIDGILGVGSGNRVGGSVIASIGAYYLWRWWRHSKNSRKKLKDRVLGVVRETAAGLKVVPVAGGAR